MFQFCMKCFPLFQIALSSSTPPSPPPPAHFPSALHLESLIGRGSARRPERGRPGLGTAPGTPVLLSVPSCLGCHWRNGRVNMIIRIAETVSHTPHTHSLETRIRRKGAPIIRLRGRTCSLFVFVPFHFPFCPGQISVRSSWVMWHRGDVPGCHFLSEDTLLLRIIIGQGNTGTQERVHSPREPSSTMGFAAASFWPLMCVDSRHWPDNCHTHSADRASSARSYFRKSLRAVSQLRFHVLINLANKTREQRY